MSRCFPFPPPGYEKRLRNSEQECLPSKEKHKEKKHKKERKDKDKVEDKERNDNGRSRDKHSDGSRDKHKEKKDKKEKHKDKKRKKEKDDIGSSSNPNNETLVANETKDSKFKEELGRRIRDEEHGATNCMAKIISNTTNRKIENNATGTSSTAGKESFTPNKAGANGPDFMHRKIDKPIPPFHQSRTDGSEIPSTSTEKQNTASRYNFQQFNSIERRNDTIALSFHHKRTEGVETPAGIENQINGGSEKRCTPPNDKHTPLFHNRRTEGIETLTSMEEQKVGGSEKKPTLPMLKNFNDISKRKVQINQKVGNFATEDRRNHVTTRPFDELPNQKGETIYTVNSNQKVRNSNMASNANGLSTKSNNELEWLVESITSIPESTCSAQAADKEKELEKRNKKELENGKTEGSHKNRDGNEKNKKVKDKDKQKKKEEKKRMKVEQKHAKHVKRRDAVIKDQINDSNGKSIATPHLVHLNATSADGHDKKRKEFEMNGVLQEPQLDERPNKLPRHDASYSDQLMKNGKAIELNHVASKLGSSNNITIKRTMENNASCSNQLMKNEERIGLNHVASKLGSSSNITIKRAMEKNASYSNQSMKNEERIELNHVASKLGSSNNITVKRAMENNASYSDQLMKNGKTIEPNQVASKLGSSNNITIKRVMENNASYSDQLMKNGKTIELNHVASKLGSSSNSITIKRGMENDGNSIINGKAKVELPIMPITLDSKKTSQVIESSKKDRIRTRPPHRDAKYLDTIYSVPKLEEVNESNEQDWLFCKTKRTNIEAKESPPRVWDKGLRIEEADVFALPYVVPF